MKALMCVLIVFLSTSAWAENSIFEYNEHGKRDPFLPLVSSAGAIITYDSDLTANDMNLEGIVADPKGDNVAIINGKVLKVKDTLGPYVIEAITTDSVDVSKSGEKTTLTLKKGGA